MIGLGPWRPGSNIVDFAIKVTMSGVGKVRLTSHKQLLIRVGLNLNFEFESAHELLMNLNFIFSKSMNLNLNFVFSTSMNLNILIKHSTNFEFFDLNLAKQEQQFVVGL